jgi:hypothetical protein
MEMTIDLISDLNIIDSFNWEGQPESLMCIVAGNISNDRECVIESLTHLSEQYKHVFFIDGPNEHIWNMDDISWSYIDLVDRVEAIENVTYLHNQVCILNGVAIVPVNGWYSFDFNPEFDLDQQFMWMKEQGLCQRIEDVMKILSYGLSDCRYLETTIRKMQDMNDVTEIVVVTATAPDKRFVEHDSALQDTPLMNLQGNGHLIKCLESDTKGKVSTWMFGTYLHADDEIISGVRFVSNPRGLPQDKLSWPGYHPKRVSV